MLPLAGPPVVAGLPALLTPELTGVPELLEGVPDVLLPPAPEVDTPEPPTTVAPVLEPIGGGDGDPQP